MEQNLHKHITTRLWAIQELKRTGSKDALQLLETLLDDKDEDVRAAAKEAIRDIQGGV
ncbi:MAG TPA: HEAT repeat domain-containing protein [Thermoplasmatales archaeon]|nr:HEAT repeat domain-containing protein [Thermoplasmatales archaeon]